ncbi:START domain-containing protein, partial [Salmonella sp. s51228]|uniref:START domain-containing protein n=1 Tax=Salmonella sp. s51228 TaxID=3159652 RepID=UPI003981512A
VLSFNDQDKEYRVFGEEAAQTTYNYLTSTNWTQETVKDGMIVYSKRGKHGKIYRCEGDLQVNAERLSTYMYADFAVQTRWNTDVAEAEILKKIDNQTDICYIL